MDDTGDVPAAGGDRHRDGVADQPGLAVDVHAPADDPAAEHVEHDRQVEPADHGGDVGDVGDPLLVRSGRGEVSVEQVGRRHRGRGRLGEVPPGAAVHALPAVGPHDPRHPFPSDVHAGVAQVVVDPRRPVGASGGPIKAVDLFGEDLVGDAALRRAALRPRVEAGATDLQQVTEQAHRVERPLPVDEGEPGHFVDSVTKKAAAFFRISFSIRSCAFSRRNRTTSARSVSFT